MFRLFCGYKVDPVDRQCLVYSMKMAHLLLMPTVHLHYENIHGIVNLPCFTSIIPLVLALVLPEMKWVIII